MSDPLWFPDTYDEINAVEILSSMKNPLPVDPETPYSKKWKKEVHEFSKLLQKDILKLRERAMLNSAKLGKRKTPFH